MIGPALEFLITLFDGYKGEDLFVETRPLPSASHHSWKPQRWWAIGDSYLSNMLDYADSLKDDYDMYFGVLPRARTGGSECDVHQAKCLFVDVDQGDVFGRLAEATIPYPDYIVKSGKGHHLYWALPIAVMLFDNTDKEEFKSVLRRIAQVLHADMQACDTARILRIPGTYNLKQVGNPRKVEIMHTPILANRTHKWSYEKWKKVLPDDARCNKIKFESGFPAGCHTYDGQDEVRMAGLTDWASRGYAEGERHKKLCGAACWLLGIQEVGTGKAFELLRLKRDASLGRTFIDDKELDGIWKWASRRTPR